ncbi:hypothetical protein VTO42DRAFT_4958 [Malbranchea cinnamomea]
MSHLDFYVVTVTGTGGADKKKMRSSTVFQKSTVQGPTEIRVPQRLAILRISCGELEVKGDNQISILNFSRTDSHANCFLFFSFPSKGNVKSTPRPLAAFGYKLRGSGQDEDWNLVTTHETRITNASSYQRALLNMGGARFEQLLLLGMLLHLKRA